MNIDTAGGIMLSYADAAYAMTGWSFSLNNLVDTNERWTKKEGWKIMAKFPQKTHMMCGVAVERFGSLTVGGGRLLSGKIKLIIYIAHWGMTGLN